MMLWHVLAPTSDGGHNSLDYREDLNEALGAVAYWRSSKAEDMAVSKGPNGEPLRWVFWVAGEDRSGARFTRDVAVSVHRTRLGAFRAMAKYGRRPFDETAHTYGIMPVREWR
jgi:hypothetical protein